jgi:hypothetical protein
MTVTTKPAFIACLFTAAITGCGYVFSVYSGALKKQFSLQQSQLDTISTAYFLSGLFSSIPGLIVDRKGPKFTLILGGCAMATSLTCYWAICRKIIPVGSTDNVVVSLSLLGMVTFFGTACLTGASFATLSRNHPSSSGVAVGVAKGWVGLCGGMYTQLYTGFVKKPDDSPDTLNFILMSGFLALAVTLIVSPIMSVSTEAVKLRDTLRPSQYNFCYIVLVAMGVTVTTAAFSDKLHPPLTHGGHTGLAVLILLIWLSPTLLLTPFFGAEDEEETDVKDGKQEHLLDEKKSIDEDSGSELPQLTLGETVRTSRYGAE